MKQNFTPAATLSLATIEYPLEVDQISMAFMKSALVAFPFADSITACTVEDNAVQGWCSSVVRVFLKYNVHQEAASKPHPAFPASLIVKIATPVRAEVPDSLEKRKKLVASGTYKKEYEFCKLLMKHQQQEQDLNSKIFTGMFPKIYLAKLDEQNLDQFVVIMEDLGKASDQTKGCTINEAKSVMRHWAQVQAAFWNQKAIFSCDLPHVESVFNFVFSSTFFNEKQQVKSLQLKNSTVQENAQRIVDRVAERWRDFVMVIKYVEQFLSSVPDLQDCKIADLVTLMDTGHVQQEIVPKLIKLAIENSCLESSAGNSIVETLVHCDFRLDNMKIYESDQVKFFDFQCLSYGNCSYDLAQFMAQCLTREQTRHHHVELLEAYVNSLHQSNIPNYTVEKAVSDFKYALVLQLVFTIVGIGEHWKPRVEKKVDLPKAMGRFFVLGMKLTENVLGSFCDSFLLNHIAQ